MESFFIKYYIFHTPSQTVFEKHFGCRPSWFWAVGMFVSWIPQREGGDKQTANKTRRLQFTLVL